MSDPAYPADLAELTDEHIATMRVAQLRPALERAVRRIREQKRHEADIRDELNVARAAGDDLDRRVARAEARLEELRETLSLERARVAALTGAEVERDHYPGPGIDVHYRPTALTEENLEAIRDAASLARAFGSTR